MKYIDVTGEIVDGYTQAFMNAFGYEELSFSVANLKKLLEESDDEGVTLNIDSIGGNLHEAFTMYDLLRGSGKTIHANIIGDCSSSATLLLLSAPKQNRSANRNASSVLHFASSGAWGKVEDLENKVEEMREANDRLLDIYAERTGASREALTALMDKDKRHSISVLVDLGFVSSVNDYNTAQYMLSRSEHEFNTKLSAIARGLAPTPDVSVNTSRDEKDNQFTNLLNLFKNGKN